MIQRIACALCLTGVLGYFALSLHTRHRGNWPIARYCMYCFKAESLPDERSALFGVLFDAEGRLVEENLLTRERFRRFFAPMVYRPEDVFTMMGERGAPEEQLAALLLWYERRRAAGRHDGPRYRGVRLYMVDVDGSMDLRTQEDPKRRRLVAEYLNGSEHGAR